MSESSTKITRLKHFLGIERSMTGVLGMVILVGMGEHLAERFLPLYLQLLVEGATATFAIGLLAGMDDLLSALYSFPGGYLSDRFGAKRSLLIFNLLSIAGYLIVIFIHSWWAVLLGAAFFISWSAISLPATMEIVARVVPKAKRTMGVSIHSLIRRIPKMLGPIVGGTFIAIWGVDTGVRYAFVCALGLALAAIIMQQILIQDDSKDASPQKAQKNPLVLLREMSPNLRSLLVSDILIRFCERIPDAFVVIWVTRAITSPVSEFTFGWLSAIENITAFLIYIPVAYMADRFGKKLFVAITFGFFTLFPLMLMFSQSIHLLIPVFIIRGLKEFGEPTRKALIMDLAPEDRKAAMFGAYYLVRDVIVSIAAFGGAGLWAISPQVNFSVAFAFGVVGTVWFIIKGSDLPVLSTCK